MSEFDWTLSAGAPLCELSDTLYRTGRDAIFRQITRDTTPEQFEEAVASLTRHRDELVQSRRPMHYGSLIGRHRCVEQVFKEAHARLRALQIMQPAPQVPAPPPPQLITREGIVIDLEEKIQTNRAETHLGTDDTQPGNRNTR
jgi:hypothetical protein